MVNCDYEKVLKLFQELWDNDNITSKEYDSIKYLIDTNNIDLNKRWNILKEVQKR